MQLQKKFSDTVHTISLNVDHDKDDGAPPQDLQDEALEMLREKQISTENVICSGECDTVLESLDIVSLPAVVVYNQEGKLHKLFADEFTYDDVTAEVESLTK